jgi:hypothetical protein
MVKILVTDLVTGADSVAQGSIISDSLCAQLALHDVVILSFHGIGAASSSFVSAALIRALRSMSFDDFKRRVRIADASWQIADVVKRRVYLEMETA